jgi:hypothetical protein
MRSLATLLQVFSIGLLANIAAGVTVAPDIVVSVPTATIRVTSPQDCHERTVHSPNPLLVFGYSVTHCDDVNGDAVLDIVVASPPRSDANLSGTLTVYSGHSCELLWSVNGPQTLKSDFW